MSRESLAFEYSYKVQLLSKFNKMLQTENLEMLKQIEMDIDRILKGK